MKPLAYAKHSLIFFLRGRKRRSMILLGERKLEKNLLYNAVQLKFFRESFFAKTRKVKEREKQKQ